LRRAKQPTQIAKNLTTVDEKAVSEITLDRRRVAIMPNAIEQRLDLLVHELSEIKKELIMQKTQQSGTTDGRLKNWKSLGSRISQRWDHVSAIDEIHDQREKR
jgi:hypothetical protein